MKNQKIALVACSCVLLILILCAIEYFISPIKKYKNKQIAENEIVSMLLKNNVNIKHMELQALDSNNFIGNVVTYEEFRLKNEHTVKVFVGAGHYLHNVNFLNSLMSCNEYESKQNIYNFVKNHSVPESRLSLSDFKTTALDKENRRTECIATFAWSVDKTTNDIFKDFKALRKEKLSVNEPSMHVALGFQAMLLLKNQIVPSDFFFNDKIHIVDLKKFLEEKLKNAPDLFKTYLIHDDKYLTKIIDEYYSLLSNIMVLPGIKYSDNAISSDEVVYHIAVENDKSALYIDTMKSLISNINAIYYMPKLRELGVAFFEILSKQIESNNISGNSYSDVNQSNAVKSPEIVGEAIFHTGSSELNEDNNSSSSANQSLAQGGVTVDENNAMPAKSNSSISHQSKNLKASFDCSMATSNQEKIICSDQELVKLDIELDELYNKVFKISKNKDELKEFQTNWTKFRAGCIDKQCLLHIYEARIMELSEVFSDLTISDTSNEGSQTSDFDALPYLCRDEDFNSDGYKVYSDLNLTTIFEGHNSMNSVFLPSKRHVINSKIVYEGTLGYFSNGEEIPGIFYIDANEWRTICK